MYCSHEMPLTSHLRAVSTPKKTFSISVHTHTYIPIYLTITTFTKETYLHILIRTATLQQ